MPRETGFSSSGRNRSRVMRTNGQRDDHADDDDIGQPL